MKRRTFLKYSSAGGTILLLTPAGLVTACNQSKSQSSLDDIFLNPPDSAKARTWWHWMNGSVTKEGITLDMEAMKKAGVGGFQIFDVGSAMVQGPVAYHSAEWLEMKEHAAMEAERLGLAFEMHNCPGWSSSGGPWITPELSMQYLVWSEAYVTGGKTVSIQMPQPNTSNDYYRDAMVLAFPSLKGEEKSMQDLIVNAVSNAGAVDKALFTNYDLSSAVDIEKPQSGDSAYLQLELSESIETRSATLYGFSIGLQTAPGERGVTGTITLEASGDGSNFRKICDFSAGAVSTRGGIVTPSLADFPPVNAKFYRLVSDTGFRVSYFQLSNGRIASWASKSGMGGNRGFPGSSAQPEEALAEIPSGSVIDPETVLDISSYMDSQGQLEWEAPEGDWTIIRFGQTPTGITNNAAPDQGLGLECDKFSKEAFDFHFEKMFSELLPSLENLGEQGMVGALIDSYEVGAQNWTATFPRQFTDYRGYDLVKYMPAMTGRVVGNAEISDRFLYDIRRTISDLLRDNYYKHFDEVCNRHGIISYAEPYSPPCDEMGAGSKIDIPMGEFWIRGGFGGNNRNIRLAASIAHTTDNGNQIVGAESFTGEPTASKWQECPYMMKAQGDLMYAAGLNQFIFHRYAHQPHPTAAPGMTMGPWGFHFDRTNTWFPKATGWLEYVARSQNMLRSGLFVADVVYFVGEEQPPRVPDKSALSLELPEGYDYDTINADTILHHMKVEGNRLVVDSGTSYRVLVLADEDKMTLELLEKIEDLVKQGACVVGRKPLSSPSLEEHLNNTDAQVKAMADEMWGGIDGNRVTENAYGKGEVIWGQALAEVLDGLGVQPDFEYTSSSADPVISYIHRNFEGNDFYFVANGRRRAEDLVCTFRVEGKMPELWDAVSGKMAPAAVYELTDGGVRMPLRLDFADSVFVVFRTQAPSLQVNTILKGNDVLAGIQPFPVQERGRYGAVSNTFTVSLWAKPEIETSMPGHAFGNRMVVNYAIYPPSGGSYYGAGHAAFGLTVGRNGAVVYEKENDNAPMVLVADMPLAGWTHIAVTYKNGTPSIYVNGELAGTGKKSGFIVHPVMDEAYADEGASGFEGDVGGLELHDDALDISRIRALASGGIPAPEAPPAIELNGGTTGNAGLICWQGGSYSLVDSSGGSRTMEVEDPGAPVEISGPWKVSFPDGLGAPPEITMDRLASLHRHDVDGVKYFSGTATYASEFDVPAGSTGNGKRLFLDLGRVEVLAEVTVNGREAGLFWKPPYRIDISDYVQAGNNELEVRVTNLWPNRLIGDEHLPEEYGHGAYIAYAGQDGCINEIPEWFLNGGEKPGQRITFTTWRHYTKDDALLESGLIGPVKLRTAYIRDINA